MKKIHDQYSADFIDKLTEQFISGPMARGNEDRIRAEILKVRARDYSPLFLEMYFAVISIQLEDAIKFVNMSLNAMEIDDLVIDAFHEETALTDKILAYHEGRSVAVAKAGGDGRAAKLKDLEKETIKLYQAMLEDRDSVCNPDSAGKRTSIPLVAQKITPLIVDLSKRNGVNLLPTTTKPLAWIRAYVKSQK